MRNDLIEVVFILDKSGSMNGLEKDTIGGYNKLLEEQKLLPGDVTVSTVLFNDAIEVIHDRVSIKEVNAITENEYYVGGLLLYMMQLVNLLIILVSNYLKLMKIHVHLK